MTESTFEHEAETANQPLDQSLYTPFDPEADKSEPAPSTPDSSPQDMKVVRLTTDGSKKNIQFSINAKLLAERIRIRELNGLIRQLGGAE